jgi:hypothetical protein
MSLDVILKTGLYQVYGLIYVFGIRSSNDGVVGVDHDDTSFSPGQAHITIALLEAHFK